jgi:hypothetical protein
VHDALEAEDAPLAPFGEVRQAVGFDDVDRWEALHACE